MAGINKGKPKKYADSVALTADSGSQNLNVDLEKVLADELDAQNADLIGGNAVLGATSFGVTGKSSLKVDVAAGIAYLDGQRARATATQTYPSGNLPDNTDNILVYVTVDTAVDGNGYATAPYSVANNAWPAKIGHILGTSAAGQGQLSAGQLFLARAKTLGGVSTITEDGRVFLMTHKDLADVALTAAMRLAAAGSYGTPGASNKYVTQDDPARGLSNQLMVGVL